MQNTLINLTNERKNDFGVSIHLNNTINSISNIINYNDILNIENKKLKAEVFELKNEIDSLKELNQELNLLNTKLKKEMQKPLIFINYEEALKSSELHGQYYLDKIDWEYIQLEEWKNY